MADRLLRPCCFTWLACPDRSALATPAAAYQPLAYGTIPGSPERNRIHQPAIGPQGVGPAIELQRTGFTDVPLIRLAVVADLLDDRQPESVVHPQQLAEIPRLAE